MKIVVCVKQVIDTSVALEVDLPTGAVKWADADFHTLNPADVWGIRRAAQLKEELQEGSITAISLGPERTIKALRDCLSLGADAALRIDDSGFGEPLDTLGTALVLSRAVNMLNPDLVMCGAVSADTAMRSFGPVLAEIMERPHVSDVVDFQVEEDRRGLIARRQLGQGDRESVWCPLPALLSLANTGCSSYASLPMIMRAQRSPIQTLTAADLGFSSRELASGLYATRLVGVSPPRPRPKKIFTPDSNLPPEERLRQLLAGGPTRQKQMDLLEGGPDELAAGALDFMRQQKIL